MDELIFLETAEPYLWNGKEIKRNKYLCYCGKEFFARETNVNTKRVKSCGCLKSKLLSKRNEKHNKSETKIYKKFSDMKQRCFLKTRKDFQYYGGRGITICNEWLSDFMSFYDWAMANGYEDDLTIDRINNDGNYEPSNCRWVTMSAQARNSRDIRSSNTSGYRGVSLDKSTGRYLSNIRNNRKFISIGYFSTAKEAVIARNNYIIDNNVKYYRIQEV